LASSLPSRLMSWAWPSEYGASARRRRLDDPPPPAAPSSGGEVNLGQSSVLIKYTIDTNIGTATLSGLEDALENAVSDGTLDAIMSSHSSSNTSALAKVECSLPTFSNEQYNAPVGPKPKGMPAYAIALIAISCAVVLCGCAYGAYYVHHEKSKGEHGDNRHLMAAHPVASDSIGSRRGSMPAPPAVEVEMQGGASLPRQQPRPDGDEQIDSFGANPYAGQMARAPRRVSTQPQSQPADL